MSSTAPAAAPIPIPHVDMKRCGCGALYNGWWMQCAECEYGAQREQRQYYGGFR